MLEDAQNLHLIERKYIFFAALLQGPRSRVGTHFLAANGLIFADKNFELISS